jgi:hypothetical protein
MAPIMAGCGFAAGFVLCDKMHRFYQQKEHQERLQFMEPTKGGFFVRDEQSGEWITQNAPPPKKESDKKTQEAAAAANVVKKTNAEN